MFELTIPSIVIKVKIVVTQIAVRAGTALGVIQNDAHVTATIQMQGK